MDINLKTKYAIGDSAKLEWDKTTVTVTIVSILVCMSDGDIFYKYTVLLNKPIGKTLLLEGVDEDEFV